MSGKHVAVIGIAVAIVVLALIAIRGPLYDDQATWRSRQAQQQTSITDQPAQTTPSQPAAPTSSGGATSDSSRSSEGPSTSTDRVRR